MDEKELYPDKYWHCNVELAAEGKKNSKSAVFNDLTFEELNQQIILPWKSGRAFTVNGMIIKNAEDIQKIKITNTAEPQSYYADKHNIEMQNSGITDFLTDRSLLPLYHGKDYTNDFLFREEVVVNSKKDVVCENSNKVFIVHGHDEQVKESTARFIEKLDLNAVILHEQANEGKTIIEKLEKHTDASYAIVLFTPDDLGSSVKTPENLQPRARQNVLVELGYMAAKIGRDRVCVLRKGEVDIPSDFLGVLYIDIDDGGAWRLALAKELKVTGLKVDLNNAM